MILQKVVDKLGLDVLVGDDLAPEITGGYASDLLSCVMARAKAGNVWVTLQAHPNVVAIASLLELSAVIITEGITPDPETVLKARENAVVLLTTGRDTFSVVGDLAGLGIRGSGTG
jgi:hypothetical protein